MHGQMGECFVHLPLFLPPLFKITQFHLFPSYATFLALILNETFYWGGEDQLLILTHFPLTYGTPFFWGGGQRFKSVPNKDFGSFCCCF